MKKSEMLSLINEDAFEARYKLINTKAANDLLKIYQEEYELPSAPLTKDLEAQTRYALTKMVLYDFLKYSDFNSDVTFNEVLEILKEHKDEKKVFIEDHSPEEIKDLGDSFESLTDAEKHAYYEGYNDAERSRHLEEIIYLKG